MNHKIATYTRDNKNPNSISGDHCRGIEQKLDGWEQTTAVANPFVATTLLSADTGTNKDQTRNDIWRNQSDRVTYSNDGLKTKTTDPKGGVTLYFYDDERRPVLVIDATGAVVENTWNSFNDLE